MDAIKNALDDTLANIESVSEFAHECSLDEAINPGLYVDGVGDIGLPVSQRDVDALIARSKQSAFGFKSETRVDLKVRKTWELQADQVRFDHPLWTIKLQQIVQNVATALAVPDGVEAKLNKLLIYEKDGMFDKHKDSEKDQGMFGTLAIVLPSKHTGGDIFLQHADKTKVFRSEPKSKFGMSYFAWYADVSHQVWSVESGNRVVLTYNLVHDRNVAGLSAEEHCGNAGKELELGHSLLEWRALPNASELLVYKLNHKYTEANMCLDYLKGTDLLRGQVLFRATKVSDFDMFLASMEKIVGGGCEEDGCTEYGDEDEDESEDSGSDDGAGYHKIFDVCEKDVTLLKIFDIRGNQIGSDAHIEDDQVIQGGKAFKNVDEEDYSGWTGNEGVSATHYYRSTVIVLALPAYQTKLAYDEKRKQGQGIVDQWIQNMIEKYDTASEVGKASNGRDLEGLLKHFLAICTYRHPTFGNYLMRERQTIEPSSLDLAAQAALAMSNGELLTRLFCECEQMQPSSWYILGQAVARDLVSSDPEMLLEGLENRDLHSTMDALMYMDSGIREVHRRDDCAFARPETGLVRDCILFLLEDYSQSKTSPVTKDGPAIAVLCRWFPELASQIFAPIVEKFVAQSEFAAGFCATVLRQGDDDESSGLKISILSCLRATIENLSVSYALHRDFSRQATSIYTWPRPPERLIPSQENISGYDLAELYFEAIRLGEEHLMSKVAQKTLESADCPSTGIFDHILLPFLEQLSRLWTTASAQGQYQQELNVPESVQNFIRCLLEQYFHRYVQKEPKIPKTSWKRKGVTCFCNDCSLLNAFLISPSQKVGEFKWVEHRRKHLEGALRPRGDEFSCETKRFGSPFTLVITKGRDPTLTTHAAWTARRNEAVKLVEKLQDLGLDLILAREAIDTLLEGRSAAKKPLSNTNANQKQTPSALGPGAGVKRRWDEQKEEPVTIDLT